MGMRMKEMTVATVETGPHPEAMRREDLLQIAMLGAIIASKDIRNQIQPEFFSDKRFQCAVSELKQGKGTYGFLAEVLRDSLGVLWTKADGAPLDAMTDMLEKNGHRQYVMDMLFKASECLEVGYRTNEHLDKFFDAVKEAGHRANGWQERDAETSSKKDSVRLPGNESG